MLTKESAINKVRSYASEIKDRGINLRHVIMYGSFAKGKQHEWSDIDVALVADEFTGVGMVDKKLFPYIGSKKPYIRIESKTFPTDYFCEGDPFIEKIKKEGIVILE